MAKKNTTRKSRSKAADKYAALEMKRTRLAAEHKSGDRSVEVTGHSIWRVVTPFRSTKKAFDNPEHLWNAACDYFKWVDANPDYEEKPVIVTKPGRFTGSEVKMIKIAKKQPYTMRELCVFIGVSPGYFKQLKAHGADAEIWLPVVRDIEAIVYSQQFKGAASGFFHANLMARALGLAEKTETEVTDKRKEVADLFPEELKPTKKKGGKID